MTAYKAFKFRLYPTKEQTEQINRTLGCCRYVYNHMLERRIKAYKRRQESFSYIKMQNLLPQMKKYLPWLAEADSQALKYAAVWTMPTKAFSKTGKASQTSKVSIITTRATRLQKERLSMFPTRLSSCRVWDGCRTARAVMSKVRFAMLRFAVRRVESISYPSSAKLRSSQNLSSTR